MTDINVVVMSGNLTKDVEIRNNVAKFTIATNRSVKGQDGNWTEVASFFDWVKFLSPNADVAKLQQKLVKGTPVLCEGEARQNRWQDEQGNNRSSIQYIVNNMKINARPQPAQAPSQQNYGSYQTGGYQPQYQAPQPVQQPQQHQGPEAFDDADIPF